MEDNQPDPVDIHVGQRLRAMRKLRGLSQSDVAAHLELTFQQVQKYERGVNRVSASKMYAMAGLLGVPAAEFFVGLPDPATGEGGADPMQAFMANDHGIDLVEDFMACSKRDQLVIVRLARSMSGRADDVEAA